MFLTNPFRKVAVYFKNEPIVLLSPTQCINITKVTQCRLPTKTYSAPEAKWVNQTVFDVCHSLIKTPQSVNVLLIIISHG